MNWVNSALILVAIYGAVFLESAFQGVRHLLGTQISLLPALIVYASLRAPLVTLASAAVFGGLLYDSLSANPLGASILPLGLVGLLIYRQRGLILTEQLFAQVMLGLGASAAVPMMTLLILTSAGEQPLIGWGTVWQLIVMSTAGAGLTPACFWLFQQWNRALSYEPATQTSFRPDREIKRSR